MKHQDKIYLAVFLTFMCVSIGIIFYSMLLKPKYPKAQEFFIKSEISGSHRIITEEFENYSEVIYWKDGVIQLQIRKERDIK